MNPITTKVDQLSDLARSIFQEVQRQGPLDRIQLADIGTAEEMARIDSAIAELITRGLCERRPDLDRQEVAENDQPIGLARFRL